MPLGKPAGIEVNNVARIVLLAQSVANLVYFVGREVGHTTHPNTKRPFRGHLWETCQHAVAAQNLLWCIAADEEHIERGMVVEELHATGGVVGQRQLAVIGGVVETAIHPAAYIERDVLIATTVVDTLTVLVL